MILLETILILFLLTLPVVIVAFVYSYILTRPGMLLARPYGWLEKHLPNWLFHPVIYCEKCVSGQMALWLFPFIFQTYNPLFHIYFIAQAILNVVVLKYFYLKIETDTIVESREKKQLTEPPELKQLKQK